MTDAIDFLYNQPIGRTRGGEEIYATSQFLQALLAVRNRTGGAASNFIADAFARLNGSTEAFFQDAAPTEAVEGDYWFDTDDANAAYRLVGSTWVSAANDATAEALLTARNAADAADARVTLRAQDNEPTGVSVNDIWFDTNDALRRSYYWNGTAHVTLGDQTAYNIAAGFAGQGALATMTSLEIDALFEGYLSDITASVDVLASDGQSLAEIILSQAVRIDETRAYLDRLGLVDGVPLGTTLTTMTDARVDGDTAIVETIDLIGAASGDGTAFILDVDTVRVGPTESLATRLSTLSAADGTNAAAISSESSARASADSAIASSVTALAATVSSNTAAISTEATARATADSAIASSVTTLTTTVGGHTSTLSAYGSSIDGLSARYGVRLDVNGRVSGFVTNNDGVTSDFIIVANRFALVDPGAPGGTATVPFTYSGGVVRMHSVEINTLQVGSVSTGAVATNAITRGVAARTTGSTSIAAATWTTVQTVAITTGGGDVRVDFSGYFNALGDSSGANQNLELRVQRDGSTIYSQPLERIPGMQQLTFYAGGVAQAGDYVEMTGYIDGQRGAFVIDPAPSAASHTYTVQVYYPDGVTVSERNMALLELLR